MRIETRDMWRSLGATALLYAIVIFAAMAVLPGCASVDGAKGKVSALRERIGTTVTKSVSYKTRPDGTVETNMTETSVYNSPALDALKSLGGTAIKGL